MSWALGMWCRFMGYPLFAFIDLLSDAVMSYVKLGEPITQPITVRPLDIISFELGV